jgi:type IV pilus assembly protein PilE
MSADDNTRMHTSQISAKPQGLIMQLKSAGFTLIELVVAVAILAIIVAIAVPSYTNQVLRSNRTEAIDELLRQAAFQQATYTRTNNFGAVANYTTNSGRYSINTQIINAGQGYAITAAPQGAQTNDSCGDLILNHLGQKTVSAGDATRCWGGRNG